MCDDAHDMRRVSDIRRVSEMRSVSGVKCGSNQLARMHEARHAASPGRAINSERCNAATTSFKETFSSSNWQVMCHMSQAGRDNNYSVKVTSRCL